MYSEPSKTKTNSKGLKEYQNYVALIDSKLKTKKQRCGSHWFVVYTTSTNRLAEHIVCKSRGLVCVWLQIKTQLILLFNLFLQLFMGLTALFGTIHGSYYTISVNLYLYLYL